MHTSRKAVRRAPDRAEVAAAGDVHGQLARRSVDTHPTEGTFTFEVG